MIVSASRRTDIPAFYSQWFFNRLKEGYALIPNPRSAARLGRISLSPGIVDCIVFWTKNPGGMLPRLPELDSMGYAYYVQFTLTPYGRDLEPHLPPKRDLMQTFGEMSRRIGSQRCVWRYDPVILDAHHSIPWHTRQFAAMCEQLQSHTQRCVLSFVDPYKNLKERFRPLTNTEMAEIACAFSPVAQRHGIGLYTCAEEADLVRYGIDHGACIDRELIEGIIGSPITAKKDGNQRASCHCIESVDIGVYDTCSHGCTYCYATSSQAAVMGRVAAHDPSSPMLMGYPRDNQIITDRTTPSQINPQLSFFDRDNTTPCL